jgi:ribosomal protein S18 acetylase RimI-like enzyme
LARAEARDLRILPLAEGDIDALIELAGVIWRHHYPAMISVEQIEYMLARRYTPANLRAQMQGDGVWWDKAQLGARMIGYLHYNLGAGQDAGAMKLNQIYVHQDCQRRGHGARMLAHVEDAARRQGCSLVRLTVNKRNFNSIAAYRKRGYAVAATLVADIGGGFVMDDYVMEKKL